MLVVGAEVILRNDACVVSLEGKAAEPTINVISLDENAFSQYAAVGKPTADQVKEFLSHSPCGASLKKTLEEDGSGTFDAHFK